MMISTLNIYCVLKETKHQCACQECSYVISLTNDNYFFLNRIRAQCFGMDEFCVCCQLTRITSCSAHRQAKFGCSMPSPASWSILRVSCKTLFSPFILFRGEYTWQLEHFMWNMLLHLCGNYNLLCEICFYFMVGTDGSWNALCEICCFFKVDTDGKWNILYVICCSFNSFRP